jgi:hypothetical protein
MSVCELAVFSELQLRQAEVREILTPPVSRQEHVLGLQIPVNDPLLVARPQGRARVCTA